MEIIYKSKFIIFEYNTRVPNYPHTFISMTYGCFVYMKSEFMRMIKKSCRIKLFYRISHREWTMKTPNYIYDLARHHFIVSLHAMNSFRKNKNCLQNKKLIDWFLLKFLWKLHLLEKYIEMDIHCENSEERSIIKEIETDKEKYI